MNGLPPMDKGPEDIDEYYRRASALDPSGPTETVRRGILAHAAQLAAARARQRSAPGRGGEPALVGSLMAAGLAGLLMTPHFRIPTPSSQNAAPASAAKQAAPSETQSISVQAQRILKPAAPRAPVPQAMSPAMSPPDLESRAAGGAEPYALRQQNQSPARAEAYSDKAARTAASTAAVTSSPVIGASDPGRALRRAAQAGDIAAVQLLIDQHADIESRDAGGRTALMLAALNGQSAAVDELLAHGADPGASDAQGLTPLRAALARNYREIAASLERAGAR